MHHPTAAGDDTAPPQASKPAAEAQDPLEEVTLRRHVRIPMRDGVHLSADLFMPRAPGRYPVVLEYLPYRKDDRSHAAQDLHAELARRGYVGCRLDVRGTGSSEGDIDDEYTLTEQLDGCDAVAWLAEQPWSNGNVGMWGISYGGFNALQVAMHRPPALKAIVPVMFTDDRYGEECHFAGGSVRGLYTWSDYPLMMVALNALPPHPEAAADGWLERWRERLEAQRPWVLRWLEEQTDGPYWANGSLNRDYGAVECASYLIGGWRDGYPNAPLRTFAHLDAPKKVLVGPWTHALPHQAFPGPQVDFLHEATRFFDHWLKGVDNGVMDEPPVTVYVQEHGEPAALPGDWPGRWRTEPQWPPEAHEGRSLHPASDGRLLEAPPEAPGVDAFAYDPTVGLAAGIWCWATPVEQGEDDARSLLYDGAPLAEPLEIVGPGYVELGLQSDAEVAGLAVRLEDVAPDGTSVLVTKGYLNATRRASMERPEPLTPGEVHRLRVPLDATAWRFRPGHRVRLALAGAEWPNVWPTPFPSRHRVHWGGAAPARLRLPAMRGRGGEAQLPSPRPLPAVAERGGGRGAWTVTRDRIGGGATVEVAKQQALRSRIRDTGFRMDKHTRATASREDPSEVRVEGTTTIVLDEQGRRVETVARAVMTGERERFDVSIELDVRLDGRAFFARRWDRSIPRRLM